MAKGYAVVTDLCENWYPYESKGFNQATLYGCLMAQMGRTATVARIEDDDTYADLFVVTPPKDA